MLRGNESGSGLDLTLDDPDLNEVLLSLAGLNRAKNYWVRVAAFNAIGLGPFSDSFRLELDADGYGEENEMAVENSTRYTWLIALFGSLIFMLILVMSVLVMTTQ